jgi:GNAT superfamily N-acetyltransferase
MEVSVFPPGQELPDRIFQSVHELFVASYHRYHYLAELADPSRVKVAAVDRGEVVGYASARISGRYAHLANLLVRREWRGEGVGRQLEWERYAYVRSAGLSAYVSCTCEDGSSQRLKLELGMRPVAVKVGYRRDVVGPGSRGSAVIYTDAVAEAGTPARDRLVHEPVLGRVRYIAARSDPAVYGRWDVADTYVEILTGPDSAQALVGRPGLRFAGLDRDDRTDRWHYCFQVCNRAYWEGLRAGPTVVALPAFSGVPVLSEVRS